MSKVEKLLDTEARNQVESDALVQANIKAIRDRVQELLETPIERNQHIWQLFEVASMQAVIDDYMAVEIKDRDIAWGSELGTMIAAAQWQAKAEIVLGDMLAVWENHSESIIGITKSMSVDELKKASRQGVGKARRERLKNA